ncbi:MAG: ABC transporter permease subunit [Gammaproteobacteria bacterium]|jgi:peptide/nickel transport system permease protein|nr:ABC transporter permease subunit [Gammaproteobacteria bacterium]NCF83780.1 ABC transporter permease subunit [Pseudomonadota bacterium]
MTEEANDATQEIGLEAAGARPLFQLSLMGKVGVGILVFWILVALIGPFLAPYDPADIASDDSFGTLSATHWLGTDYIGRDILSRVMHGARLTMSLSFMATVLAFLVGISLGFTAALAGSKVDMVISRIYDAFLSMPTIMLGLVVIAALGSSIPVLVITAGLIYSCGLYRIARALAIDIKVMDFVEAARARGEKLPWIISREILPNAVIPLVAEFGLRLVFSILFITGLSFLGLGVQPPTADWGIMVRENIEGLWQGSSAVLAPAGAIATLTIGINLIVDDFSAQRGQEIAEEMI